MATPTAKPSKKEKPAKHRAAHASFNKPYKLIYQKCSKAARRVLLDANDAYDNLRRSGYKESWWHHSARDLKSE